MDGSTTNRSADSSPWAAHAAPTIVDYLAKLSNARAVLWCYLLWYLVVAARYFEPSVRLWLTSAGLSLIIGIALLLNAQSGEGRISLSPWQRFRFFLMPFCVSSFAALVKGRGFVLVFSSDWRDITLGVSACGAFLGLVVLARRSRAPS